MAYGTVIAALITSAAGYANSQEQAAASRDNANTNAATAYGLYQGVKDSTESNQRQVSNLTPQQIAQLQSLSGILQGSSQGFSKEAAFADSEAFQQSAIRKLKESGLPGVFGAEAQGGAYNSTSRKLQANDLTARTAESIASQRSSLAAQYGDVQRGQLQASIDALGRLFGSQTSEISQQNTLTTDLNQKSPNDNASGVQLGRALQGLYPQYADATSNNSTLNLTNYLANLLSQQDAISEPDSMPNFAGRSINAPESYEIAGQYGGPQ